MNDNRPLNYRTFPFVWPWRGVNNIRISLKEMFLARAFSYSYLLVIWGIVFVLGFASTRNCTGTWQLALQCEYAFWVENVTKIPLIFIRNLFTTSLFHNGPDHILFVTIFGVFIIIQSYEVLYGYKESIFMFFLAYVIVGFIFGIFYQTGLAIWPESAFHQFAFERNWMGGSLGFFFMYGALACSSKRPFVLLSIPAVFESVNFFVLDIDPQISLTHITSTSAGYLVKRLMEARKSRKRLKPAIK